MEGTRVVVTVDGDRRAGTVASVAYTVKGGQPVLTVALDEPLPDGREQFPAAPDAVDVT